ncbi:hypothetical protein PUN28_015831 [Cardiocondyla obscurior]|uniref:Uncharacterized protein n=1 Tax=Cardiocondyla obscurior TaxID=286306 RepID=A0AAW2ET42_9HYME
MSRGYLHIIMFVYSKPYKTAACVSRISPGSYRVRRDKIHAITYTPLCGRFAWSSNRDCRGLSAGKVNRGCYFTRRVLRQSFTKNFARPSPPGTKRDVICGDRTPWEWQGSEKNVLGNFSKKTRFLCAFVDL